MENKSACMPAPASMKYLKFGILNLGIQAMTIVPFSRYQVVVTNLIPSFLSPRTHLSIIFSPYPATATATTIIQIHFHHSTPHRTCKEQKTTSFPLQYIYLSFPSNEKCSKGFQYISSRPEISAPLREWISAMSGRSCASCLHITCILDECA